jgi:dTDP-4-amino-4,6-dideoxygalactose transaminase
MFHTLLALHQRDLSSFPYTAEPRSTTPPWLPGAAAWYRQCLSLPLFPAMADADVDRVVDALSRALA